MMASIPPPMKTLTALRLLTLAACATTPAADDRGIVHKSDALKYAAADLVAHTLSAEGGETPGHRIVVVADSRQNAVVVRGTPGDHVRLEKRIRELDVR